MLNSEYQRGLEAAAKFLESQINDYARPISLQAWAAAIRGLTPQEVCPTCGSAKKGVFDASAPNLNKHCWAKGWHDPWHDGGLTPQPERGDPTVGRTIDEGRRPLVCFVCGKHFGITFNFCLEHKDEYEKLKREESVVVPQPAAMSTFRCDCGYTCGNCGVEGNSHEIEVHMAEQHYYCAIKDCSVCKRARGGNCER